MKIWAFPENGAMLLCARACLLRFLSPRVCEGWSNWAPHCRVSWTGFRRAVRQGVGNLPERPTDSCRCPCTSDTLIWLSWPGRQYPLARKALWASRGLASGGLGTHKWSPNNCSSWGGEIAFYSLEPLCVIFACPGVHSQPSGKHCLKRVRAHNSLLMCMLLPKAELHQRDLRGLCWWTRALSQSETQMSLTMEASADHQFSAQRKTSPFILHLLGFHGAIWGLSKQV